MSTFLGYEPRTSRKGKLDGLPCRLEVAWRLFWATRRDLRRRPRLPKWPPSTNSSNSISPTPMSPTPPAISPTPTPVNNSSPSPSTQHNLSTSSRSQSFSPARNNCNGYSAESPTPIIVPPAPEFADIPPTPQSAPVPEKVVVEEPPLSPAHALLHQSNHFDDQNAAEDDEQDWESPPVEATLVTTETSENIIESDAHGYGIRARALYDYQAG